MLGGREERSPGETRPRTVRVGSPGAGAERTAARRRGSGGGITDARRARDRLLTFAVEAGRVVVVEGRQLASEHGARCSLRSPRLRPGEERRGGAGGTDTGDAARGRAGVGRSEMTAALANRSLGTAAAGQCPPIAAPAAKAGPRRGTSTLK